MTQGSKGTGSRPGWRGPGMTKAKNSQTQKAKSKTIDVSASNGESPLPRELQQLLLNIFRDTFPSLSQGGSETLKPLLQEVKQALFDRDFERAFGRDDYREAYAFRWSPSRALCYASVLADLQEHLSETRLFRSLLESRPQAEAAAGAEQISAMSLSAGHHVVCLGGGAAEIVAFGGLLKYLPDMMSDDPEKQEDVSPAPMDINLLVVDTAAWGNLIQKLSRGLMTAPPLSKYASSSVKAANAPLLPERSLNTTFHQGNLLDMTAEQLEKLLGPQPILLTMLFTLNELYSSSITKTTVFLLNLTVVVPQGSMLLVLDSPGSYSETSIGRDSKKYPMQWLVDHTLLGKQLEHREQAEPDWEKLVSDDSRWFRMLEELRYPISLENMRYQVHLFRRR